VNSSYIKQVPEFARQRKVRAVVDIEAAAAAMALALATPTMRMASSGTSFLPRLIPTTLLSAYRIPQIQFRQLSLPFLPSVTLAIPMSFQLGLPPLPSILEGIWESILKAVPKKKTSHMKKRHRQMAGKALKDVTELCKCPACGETKMMHRLCPKCSTSKSCLLKTFWNCTC
jgi:large subunit ribosomal protein L32